VRPDAPRILILTTFGLDEYVYEALRAGASGFMLQDSPPEELVAAVRIVARGDALRTPAVTRSVVEEFRSPLTDPAATDRRRRAPDQTRALGLRSARPRTFQPEICRRLVVSEATTKTHVARILQKLGLRDRVQAVIYAYESGLVAPGKTDQ
jgi:DNA-binding NarL/FixJ family response regulator